MLPVDPSPRFPRLRRFVRGLIAWGLVVGLGLGAVGQVVRDRSVVWALLMYLPLVLIGLAAVGFDAFQRGRALPGPRGLLSDLGLAAVVGGAWPLVGFGSTGTAGSGPEVSILHWNVVWGGLSWHPNSREAIEREILERKADLVVLSEAPSASALDRLLTEMGPRAVVVQVESEPEAAYKYKLVVITRRGALRLVRREPITDGAAMVVEALVHGRIVRLLVVDARSDPRLARGARLRDVAAACRRARDAGEPIDALVGDFNTVSQSRGWDAVAAEGYNLAGRSTPGWRGTFPSFLPLYDIDHIWTRREMTGVRSEFFTNLASDHRGQVARFRLP